MGMESKTIAGPKGRGDLTDPALYINRELSWLEFNDRVLREGLNEDLPLLERLKFLAIVSSNLDEFFMVRVAGLKQQQAAGVRKRDVSGLTPAQQLARIAARVKRMVDEQTEAVRRVTEALAANGVRLLRTADLTPTQQRFARSHFESEVLPILTPLAMQELTPPPVLPGCELMLAVRTAAADDEQAPQRIVVVPVPAALGRFVSLPGEEGVYLLGLEDLLAAHVGQVLPGRRVLGTALFRLTRDADVAVDDDAAADLLEALERAVNERLRRCPVRLELRAGADAELRSWLVEQAALPPEDVYEIDGLLDAKALWEVALRPGLEKLKVADWPPQPPRDLDEGEDIWQAVQEGDVLLLHPYESFEPVVRLMEAAADDPNVLAIKQTLYRTSGESAIVGALERAARNGKQVVALVELRARFDEKRNIGWARRLEDAGALVIYGIAGYKTHAKALLIVRREPQRIRRYVHLATGNYNEKTARLYSDLGLLTCDNDVAADASAFFNLLTGLSEQVGWTKLRIAPGGIRGRFYELIDREVELSTPAEPGLILAKLNSLQDKGICRALYRASQAGVRIRLNVRGICILRPGVPGVSDNIEVVSIIDRYLEHSRIFYFRNGGHEEVYLGSADWMSRNLDKRLEILFPLLDERLRQRAIGYLKTFLADNVKARRLLPDGTYVPVERTGEPLRAQEELQRQAVEAAKAAKGQIRFRPLTRPSE